MAFLIAFLLTSICITAAGANPFEVFISIIKGAFGSPERMTEILVKATPLIFAGLGIAIAFKGGFWNIGAEGQIYLGAIAATIVGVKINLSPFILIPAVIISGFLAGGLWALIPGLLKVRFGINEIILTMMMNYIAIHTASYISHGPFRDPDGSLPQTAELFKGACLPVIINKTRLHAGILLAIFLCLLCYLIFKKTLLGYKIKAVGANPRSAFYGGINVFNTMIITIFISGGLAGLAGMGEVCGIHYRLLDGISPGYGYTAIVVALLARLHALWILLAAVLFASLDIGAGFMQRTTGIPSSIVCIIEALIVICILGSEILERKLMRKKVEK